MGNKYEERHCKNANQMFKIDSKEKFVEILEPCAIPGSEFPKIIMNFITYSTGAEKGSRLKGSGSIYFDIPYFLNICRMIKQGEARYNSMNNLPIIPSYDRANDKEGKRFILETKTESKPGRGDSGVFLKLYIGDSVKNGNLYNVNLSKGKIREIISVPCVWQKLYEMACICELRINAAVFRMEMNGYFDSKYQRGESQWKSGEEFGSLPFPAEAALQSAPQAFSQNVPQSIPMPAAAPAVDMNLVNKIVSQTLSQYAPTSNVVSPNFDDGGYSATIPFNIAN